MAGEKDDKPKLVRVLKKLSEKKSSSSQDERNRAQQRTMYRKEQRTALKEGRSIETSDDDSEKTDSASNKQPTPPPPTSPSVNRRQSTIRRILPQIPFRRLLPRIPERIRTFFRRAPLPALPMKNEWIQVHNGDAFPELLLIQACDRAIGTVFNENPVQFVAFARINGEPVFGRCCNEDGKVEAVFGLRGQIYRHHIDPIFLLRNTPEEDRGFIYQWVQFKNTSIMSNSNWCPVYADENYQIAPCVVSLSKHEHVLGKIVVTGNRASAVVKDEEREFVGPDVHPFYVLARKAKVGYSFDES